MTIIDFEPYKFLKEMLIKQQQVITSKAKQTVFFDDIEDKYPFGSDFANMFLGFLYEYEEGINDFKEAIEDKDERWNRYENYKNYFEQLLSLSDEEVESFLKIYDDLHTYLEAPIPENEKIKEKYPDKPKQWQVATRAFFEKMYHDLYHTDPNFRKDLVKYLYSL